jgi:hypothetical protein
MLVQDDVRVVKLQDLLDLKFEFCQVIVGKIFKSDLLYCQQTAGTQFHYLENFCETTTPDMSTDLVIFYRGDW